MKFLFATNVWIDFLRRNFGVGDRVRACAPDEVCLSSVVMAELRYGADRSRQKVFNHGRLDVLESEVRGAAFDLPAARIYGRLRCDLESAGALIGPYGLMIAAHALSLGLILVTANEKEFLRVSGLAIENWRQQG